MPRPFRTRQGPVECEVDTTVLNRILRNLEGNTQEAVRATAFSIEAKAKVNAPVDTGALRSSIYVRVGKEPAQMPAVEGDAERVELPEPEGKTIAHVGPSMEYGLWQELGTERMAAHPFLGPAVSSAAEELQRNMRTAVTDGE